MNEASDPHGMERSRFQRIEPTPEEKAAEELLAVYSQRMNELLGEPQERHGDPGVRKLHVEQTEENNDSETVMLHLDLGLGTPTLTRYKDLNPKVAASDYYEILEVDDNGGSVLRTWRAGSSNVNVVTRQNHAEWLSGTRSVLPMDEQLARTFDDIIDRVEVEIDRISKLPPPEGNPANPGIYRPGVSDAVGGVATRGLTDI